MKYVVFSLLFLAIAYIAASIIIKHIKHCGPRNVAPLSRDMANVCKGVASCIIMLSHIGNRFGVRFLTPLGSWGVGIFLLLSGYGLEMSASRNGVRNFWRNRIITAWLPYAVAEIIGMVICATPGYAQLSLQDIVLDLLLIRPVHLFGWYMQCLFLYYIGFYVAHKLFGNKRAGRYAVLMTVSLLQFVFLKSLFKQQVFTFVFGVLIADSIKIREKAVENPVFGALTLAAGAVCLLVRQLPFMRTLYWPYELVFSVQVLALSVGTVNVIGWLCTKFKSVFFEGARYLGLMAYEIYLYHAWIYTWFYSRPLSYLMIAVFFVVSIVIAMPIYVVRSKLIALWKGKRTE